MDFITNVHDSALAVATRASPTPGRATLRERERKSRERRRALLLQQRAVLESLEKVAVILPTLFDGDDEFWDSILAPDAVRTRRHVRRMVRLADEQRQLERDRTQLTILLQEHRLASLAIEGLVGKLPSNAWEESVMRWRATTLKYFEPWTVEECLAELERARKELNAFMWSLDTQVIGGSFFGWRVRQRIVESRDAVQFSFEKIVRGFSMRDFVKIGWATYTDEEVFQEVIIGPQAKGWMLVLQKLSPTLWIVRCAERYLSISLDAHMMYLVSLVETETGFTQFIQTLCVPEIQKRTSEPTDMWSLDSAWASYDALNEDASDYHVRLGGSLGGRDTNYAARWIIETLGVLLRAERLATKRGLITSE